jgi:hypothetical protein
MGQKAYDDNEIGTEDYIKLCGIYVTLHFIRFFCILLFWPCLRKMGYGIQTGNSLHLCWSQRSSWLKSRIDGVDFSTHK